MPRTTVEPKEVTLNLRLDPALKSEFMTATKAEAKPAAEVLRRLMREYIELAKREAYFAEARRQSLFLYATPEGRAEEEDVMQWLDRVRAPLPEEPDEDWFRTTRPEGGVR